MPANFIPLLDRMDTYIHQLPDQNQTQDETAICYSCRHCKFGRKSIVLVSRIAAYGLDFQEKRNKIAHHFIFDDPQEYAALPDGGISVCLVKENFLSRWEQSPGLLPPFTPQTRTLSSPFAQQWEAIIGDAGWAGVIAEFFLRGISPGFYVAYPPGTPVHVLLELIGEVARLLPESRRSEFTFSTLFVQSPVNWDCFLRFCLTDSLMLLPLQQSKARHFLSFTDPKPVPAEWADWELVVQAKNGLPKMQQLSSNAIPEKSPASRQVKAIPSEITSTHSYVLKKSDDTLANFVTVNGKNAAVIRNRRDRMLLFATAIPIVALLFGLGYYIFSLLSLEKSLEETFGMGLHTVFSDMPLDSVPKQHVEAQAVVPVSAQDLWHWYLAWQNLSVRIPLPESLVDAKLVSLKLGGIGMVRESLPPEWEHLAVRGDADRNEFLVLPLYSVATSDMEIGYEVFTEAVPAQCLAISIPDLQIVFPSQEFPGLKLPCHADVLEIEFLVGGEKWCWTPHFRPDFFPFLQHGQVIVQNWVLAYHPSSDEERFSEYLDVCIGSLLVDDLPSYPLAEWIRNWNLHVTRFAELEQKFNLLRLKSEEEILHFYSHGRRRGYQPEHWVSLMQKISARLQKPLEATENELSDELAGLLDEAILMLYDRAFSLFYQETGGRPDLETRNVWKEECRQLHELLQKAAENTALPTNQKTILHQLLDTFKKLPQYAQRMQEYSREAGKLNELFDELKQPGGILKEKLSDFMERINGSDFFLTYLENNRQILSDENQCQEFAALLNQNITYRLIMPENKP